MTITNPHADPTARSVLHDTSEEPVGVDVGKLREIRARDMLIRFAFGAGVSIAAGIVTLVVGNRAGGLFLAFPAILPASLTLISAKDGTRQAEIDAAGATLGGMALAVFGATSLFLLARLPLVAAQAAALVAWLITAVGAYMLVRHAMRSSRRRRRPPTRVGNGQ